MRVVGIILMCISAAIDVISFFKVMSINTMKEAESFHRLLIIGTIAFFVGLVLTLVGRNKYQKNQYIATESASFGEKLSSISAENDSKWCCKHCGQWNEKSLTICLNCGEKKAVKSTPNKSVAANEWKCSKCGKINQNYVGTCGCGQTKQANIENKKLSNNPIESLDELKKYKELLDMGAITQEEYDTKKKEILKL